MREVALCGRTLPRAGFTERVELAAAAGWRYVSLLASDLDGFASEGRSVADVAEHLRDHDVAVSEPEAVADWLPGGMPPPWLAQVPGERTCHDIADAVGHRSAGERRARLRPRCTRRAG